MHSNSKTIENAALHEQIDNADLRPQGEKNQGFITETKRKSINLFMPLLVVINAV